MVVCGGKVLSKPYPTPRLGISAPQAVSKISGCGVGVPHPIGGSALVNLVVVVVLLSGGRAPWERVLEQMYTVY